MVHREVHQSWLFPLRHLFLHRRHFESDEPPRARDVTNEESDATPLSTVYLARNVGAPIIASVDLFNQSARGRWLRDDVAPRRLLTFAPEVRTDVTFYLNRVKRNLQ